MLEYSHVHVAQPDLTTVARYMFWLMFRNVASDGQVFEAAAPKVDVRDTTGAGDLLAAAYVWGELGGLSLAERLRRAVVYATLSVQTATGAAGAATLDELEQALAGLGSTIVPGEGPETALSHTASKERA